MLGTMPSVRPRPSGSPLGSATVRAPRRARWLALTTLTAAGLFAITSCERRRGCAGEYCGTLVFAAPGEPDLLLPAVTQQQYAQDIAGQLFLKLADLGLSENTVGDEDFQPQLAEPRGWDDPLTLVFHLDPRAHWQDGRPVTAADVAFTFDIYTDSLVNSPFRSSLKTISAVTTRDSLTAVFRFHARYPEMFYDAVDHMRILPAHLLRPVPRSQWRSAALGRAPVGDGPYRFVAWKAGETIELAADSTFFLGRPHIRRLIWRSAPDPRSRSASSSPTRRTRSNSSDPRTTCGACGRHRSSPSIRTRVQTTPTSGSTWSRTATPHGRTPSSAIATCGVLWRCPWTAPTCYRACLETSGRFPRGRCPSCRGSGIPRRASFPTTPRRPPGCSRRGGGATRTATGSATDTARSSPSGCSSPRRAPHAGSTLACSRSSSAPSGRRSRSTRSRTASSSTGRVARSSTPSWELGTPT